MSEAQRVLAKILGPINSGRSSDPACLTFEEFVSNVFLPFYRVKWKRSTAMTNEQRIKLYLTPVFGTRTLDSFSRSRNELQAFLNKKAADGFSCSIVSHLRWEMRQIFRMAVTEGYLDRNPAELLFIPRAAKRPEHRVMTKEEVKRLFEALDTRGRLIAKLAILAGMRTGKSLLSNGNPWTQDLPISPSACTTEILTAPRPIIPYAGPRCRTDSGKPSKNGATSPAVPGRIIGYFPARRSGRQWFPIIFGDARWGLRSRRRGYLG